MSSINEENNLNEKEKQFKKLKTIIHSQADKIRSLQNQIKDFKLKVDTLEQEKNEYENKYKDVQKYNETLGKILNEKYEKEMAKKFKDLNNLFNETLRGVRDSFNKKYEDIERLIINNINQGKNPNFHDNINLISDSNRNINNDNSNNINFNNNNEINNNNKISTNNNSNDIFKNSSNKREVIINSNNNNSFNPISINKMNNLTDNNNNNINNNNIKIMNSHSYNINNNFLKIYYNGEPNQNLSKKKPNKMNINDIYSYECVNVNYLQKSINEGDNQTQIDVKLKNTSRQPWLKGMAKLVFESQHFKDNNCNDIILEEQKPGEEKTYTIEFNNLKVYQEGDYYSFFSLNINGQNVGKPMKFTISIEESNDEKMKKWTDEKLKDSSKF